MERTAYAAHVRSAELNAGGTTPHSYSKDYKIGVIVTDGEKAFLSDFAIGLEIGEDSLVADFRIVESDMWDSLGMVTAIGLISTHFKVTVLGEDLANCETVKDILDCIRNQVVSG